MARDFIAKIDNGDAFATKTVYVLKKILTTTQKYGIFITYKIANGEKTWKIYLNTKTLLFR